MKQHTDKISKDIAGAADQVDQTVNTVVKTTESYVAPVRDSLVKRFPTLFLLLTTFGVAATLYGFEQFIAQVSWLANNPTLILLIGVGILWVTGTLYKKLG